MSYIDNVKKRLDKVRAQEQGQAPSERQMALASHYGAVLFVRMKELREAIKARSRIVRGGT